MANLRNANELNQWATSSAKGVLDSLRRQELTKDEIFGDPDEDDDDDDLTRPQVGLPWEAENSGVMSYVGAEPLDSYAPNSVPRLNPYVSEGQEGLNNALGRDPQHWNASGLDYDSFATRYGLDNRQTPVPFSPAYQPNEYGMGMSPKQQSLTPTLDLLRAGQIPMSVGQRFRS